MNNVVTIPKPNELNDFIEFLFNGLEGYMYVVAKVPNDPDSWDQVFYEYPNQVDVAVAAIQNFSKDHEMYIAPVLYKSQRAVKETFKVSQVLWCDFDGNTPDTFDIPPSLNIRTSEKGHNHVYWKMDEPFTDFLILEEYNRRLTFKYDADNSGWDATQVLRPPYTTNHKRGGLNVYTEDVQDGLEFNLSVFNSLAPAPEKTIDYGLWEKLDLPVLNDIIYSHKFGPDFKIVFEKSKDDMIGSEARSSSLANMAYICAEAGLNDKEIYVIISHLALRWEKFKHHTRSSRARQLIGIIEHARIKYPNNAFSVLDTIFEYSPIALLNTDIELDWAIPDMLMSNGVMLMGGPSGIGKSQLSMQFQAHLAMGAPFLGYAIDKPQKIGFFSLEMGDMEVKHLLQSMYPDWSTRFTKEQIELLNENWKIIPFGESLPLNASMGQDIFVNYLESNPDWKGVFVDSVGSAIIGNINDMGTVQPFTNFNDKIRKRYGIFLWYIHHFRKPPPGTKSFGGQEDMYGDQYLTARATSVYTLTKGKGDSLRLKNPKNRHAKEQEPQLIQRVDGLYFEHLGTEDEEVSTLDKVIEQVYKKGDPSTDQTPKPFSL